MSGNWAAILALLLCPVSLVKGQGGNNDPNYRNEEYYVDRLADCNTNQEYVLTNKEAVIRGPNSDPNSNLAPLSCTIRLKTENNFQKTTIRVNIIAMKFRECGMTFSIYDGAPGQPVLDSYDCEKGKSVSEFITSGSSVSFMFTRQDARNSLFDIEVRVTSLVAGTDPGYENNWGQDYGYFNRQVPNSAIYGTIGALFLLVVLIITCVSIVCYRKKKGLDKKAESYKLSYINTNVGSMSRKPGTMSRGPESESTTRHWVNTSRENLRRERKHHRHDDDDDSVFTASVDSYPEKKKYNAHYENQQYRPHKGDRVGNARQDSYRQDSFVRADDDHPQETYIERDIHPREQNKKKYQDDVDSEEEESIEEEESEEEEKEELDEDEEVDEDDEEVDEEVHQSLPEQPPLRTGPPSIGGGIPQPQSYSMDPRQMQGDPRQMPIDPRQMPMDPRQMPGDPRQMPMDPRQMHGDPQKMPMDPRQMQGDPRQMPVGQYVMYPGQPRPQFIPMAPGPGQFQPIHLPQQSMAPPPHQPKPSEPPVYSHLVQRGYNPVDGRDSPVSVSTNASTRSDTRLIQPAADDADLSNHNIGAGVEYMRR